MTQVTIELEQAIAIELEHRAKESDKAIKTAAAWEKINKARAKYGDRVFSDSVELLREDRNRC